MYFIRYLPFFHLTNIPTEGRVTHILRDVVTTVEQEFLTGMLPCWIPPSVDFLS